MIIYAANNSQLMVYSNTMQKGRKQYLIGQNIRECMHLNLIRCYYLDCIQYIVYDWIRYFKSITYICSRKWTPSKCVQKIQVAIVATCTSAYHGYRINSLATPSKSKACLFGCTTTLCGALCLSQHT